MEETCGQEVSQCNQTTQTRAWSFTAHAHTHRATTGNYCDWKSVFKLFSGTKIKLKKAKNLHIWYSMILYVLFYYLLRKESRKTNTRQLPTKGGALDLQRPLLFLQPMFSFLCSSLMLSLDFSLRSLSVWGLCDGHLFWSLGQLQGGPETLRDGHSAQMGSCLRQQDDHCNGDELFYCSWDSTDSRTVKGVNSCVWLCPSHVWQCENLHSMLSAAVAPSRETCIMILKHVVMRWVKVCLRLPRWTQMVTGVCWPAAGTSRTLVA